MIKIKSITTKFAKFFARDFAGKKYGFLICFLFLVNCTESSPNFTEGAKNDFLEQKIKTPKYDSISFHSYQLYSDLFFTSKDFKILYEKIPLPLGSIPYYYYDYLKKSEVDTMNQILKRIRSENFYQDSNDELPYVKSAYLLRGKGKTDTIFLTRTGIAMFRNKIFYDTTLISLTNNIIVRNNDTRQSINIRIGDKK